MLINLRNALMAGKRLPYDAEVEYLQSDGQAFANTGFIVEKGSKITCTIGMTSSYGSGYGYFGASDGTGSYLGGGFNCTSPFKDRRLSVWVKNKLWWCSTARATDIYQDGALHSMSIDLSSSSPSVSFDSQGISYAAGYTSGVAAMPSIPLCLFAVNSAGTAKIVPASAALKIGSFRVEKNGETKLDIIAVRKGTVGYLYDRVSGKLFGNAGTGDFVLGQDVVPVEWLEAPGSGTYIMTGVTPAESSTVDFDLNIGFAPASSGARNIIGDGQNTKNHYSSITAADRFGAGSAATATALRAATMYNAKTSITSSGIMFYITVGGVEESRGITAYPSATYGEFMLFRRAYNALGTGGARIKSAVMNVNGITVRRFYAVRVGTEGAMIDVLTRRIYRNAGTGVFGYGNDLKYPIPAE